MATTSLHLGFEVGTGKPVSIPLRHMCVCGQTQESGKTTTLDALISRADSVRALAFITKRGEGAFTDAFSVEPYFRERADWQFVAAVLEATMRERMKFERSWIMRASKGAKTLAEVQRNVRALGAKAKSGFAQDMYNVLDEYLEIVVPRIARIHFADSVRLHQGVNVVNISNPDQPHELQALVMRSMIEWIYEREKDVVTIIPEAWEFIPQGRNSPVKLAVEQLVRKGAGLHNYVWIDSQDIAGVDKMVLRACPVWLLGVQREANEVKRTLENIPAGVKKPKAAAIATLQKGQFFACYGEHVIKTYVQPAWMDPGSAKQIAMGKWVAASLLAPPPKPHARPSVVLTPKSELTKGSPMSAETDKKLLALMEEVSAHLKQSARCEDVRLGVPTEAREQPAGAQPKTLPSDFDADDIYEYVRDRLLREEPAALMKLIKSAPEIEVKVTRPVLELDESTTKGKVAILISEGFFSEALPGQAAYKELQKRWAFSQVSTRVYEAIDELHKLGFLRRLEDKKYTSIGARVRTTEA